MSFEPDHKKKLSSQFKCRTPSKLELRSNLNREVVKNGKFFDTDFTSLRHSARAGLRRGRRIALLIAREIRILIYPAHPISYIQSFPSFIHQAYLREDYNMK